ncbi:MAG: hypothetical protein ACI4JA_08085 [Oscillospiraceae bacterium]
MSGISADPYVLDMDENNFPAFTEKNIIFINGIIKIDSGYRDSFDETCESSSAGILSKGFPTDKDTLERVVRLIDKENSTHLSVSGNTKNSNQGIKLTVEGLSLMTHLSQKIEKGESGIVNDIAGLVKGRNNISFASKFCAFCNRYCFRKDDYSIYDSVLCEVLPYYAYVYCGEKYFRHKTRGNKEFTGTISETFGKKDATDYKGYNQLIGKIIAVIREKVNKDITRKDFDLLLWYYFKGSDRRRKEIYTFLDKLSN